MASISMQWGLKPLLVNFFWLQWRFKMILGLLFSMQWRFKPLQGQSTVPAGSIPPGCRAFTSA
ncbi:MAG: hypothetical protein GY940_39440 [bacterium]|nr:hypothetical protein [bacterium]